MRAYKGAETELSAEYRGRVPGWQSKPHSSNIKKFHWKIICTHKVRIALIFHGYSVSVLVGSHCPPLSPRAPNFGNAYGAAGPLCLNHTPAAL